MQDSQYSWSQVLQAVRQPEQNDRSQPGQVRLHSPQSASSHPEQ